jgi:hypothetical protein
MIIPVRRCLNWGDGTGVPAVKLAQQSRSAETKKLGCIFKDWRAEMSTTSQ